MIGIPVTRDVALRVLAKLELRLAKDAGEAQLAGEVPTSPGHWRAWVDSREEELLTLQALREHVEKLPLGTVLRPADTEAA